MADTCQLTGIRFRRAPERLAATGLLAFVDCDHGLITLRGIELRRTRDGETTISFAPARAIHNRWSCWARPISDPARRAMQREIVAAAVREGWIK